MALIRVERYCKFEDMLANGYNPIVGEDLILIDEPYNIPVKYLSHNTYRVRILLNDVEVVAYANELLKLTVDFK